MVSTLAETFKNYQKGADYTSFYDAIDYFAHHGAFETKMDHDSISLIIGLTSSDLTVALYAPDQRDRPISYLRMSTIQHQGYDYRIVAGDFTESPHKSIIYTSKTEHMRFAYTDKTKEPSNFLMRIKPRSDNQNPEDRFMDLGAVQDFYSAISNGGEGESDTDYIHNLATHLLKSSDYKISSGRYAYQDIINKQHRHMHLGFVENVYNMIPNGGEINLLGRYDASDINKLFANLLSIQITTIEDVKSIFAGIHEINRVYTEYRDPMVENYAFRVYEEKILNFNSPHSIFSIQTPWG